MLNSTKSFFIERHYFFLLALQGPYSGFVATVPLPVRVLRANFISIQVETRLVEINWAIEGVLDSLTVNKRLFDGSASEVRGRIPA